MPDERRLTIGSAARLSPEEVAHHSFSTGRRGFDPNEVRGYLETVARELHALQQRQTELLDALSAAEHRAANPVLDESTLTTALGQETAKVLRSAHDAAGELVARAEADAARLRAQAEEEGEQIRTSAEQLAAERGAQVEAAATEVRRRVQQEETSRIEAAKLEAEAFVSEARAECRAMVHEAQELRARVLSDLTRRRRVLHTQIEQLRAGRERLAQTIGDVRLAVDRVTDDLFRAEDEARLAAEAAGRQAVVHDELEGGVDRLVLSTAGIAEPVLAPSVGAREPEPAAVTEPAGMPSPQEPSPPAEGAPPLPDEKALLPDEELLVSDEEAEGEQRRQQAVEDLFARLRAEQAPVSEEGITVLGPLPPGPGSNTVTPAGAPGATSAVAMADEALQQAAEPEQAGAQPAGDREAEAQPAQVQEAAAEEADSEEASPRDPAVARRDDLLSPALSGLARKLKRTLADDQNDMLDRLRGRRRFDAEVLGPEEEHERRYREAAEGALADAARAGASFAGGSPDAVTAGDAAEQLARSIVAPLRRRLLDQPLPADEGDEAAMADHVGSAFREWKGQRVERVAADHAHGAFWQAALAVTPHEQLHWVVDDDGARCPDCDDNALAGSLPAGEKFPTGHVHPPAHPGCRCLLVAGPA